MTTTTGPGQYVERILKTRPVEGSPYARWADLTCGHRVIIIHRDHTYVHCNQCLNAALSLRRAWSRHAPRG